MQTDVSIARLKQFPRLMWILLFGSFITRGSYYMVWPFLAVLLYEEFALTATEVGMVLSGAAVISVFTSFAGSALSDWVGRQKLMYMTGVLYIISFSLLAEVDTVKGYVVAMTLCSIATSLWRPLGSALIGDIIPDKQTRELAMQSWYFVVNVGCAVGPMLGIWLGLTGQQSSFYITAGAFVVLLILLFWGFKHQAELDKASAMASGSFDFGNEQNCEQDSAKEAKVPAEHYDDSVKTNADTQPVSGKRIASILLQDKLFHCLILANTLCMFIYAQMDSSLIQYLTREQAPQLLTLISSMIFTNALVIISSQFLLLKLMADYSLTHRIQCGLVLLLISQCWMAANPVDLFWGWIGAVVVMSLAETILFPTMNVHIDRLAPAKLRGAYFGAASFYEFGFAFAPFGGGIILDSLGGSWLFIIGAGLCVVVMGLYKVLPKFSRPDFASVS
ncbi:MFS transporter [Shewanella sp. UCD-FRSSP16_17]|uniref:MFS transporter n=1 Tax=unclassified Shewanella TaxID=196818 RepID=UPI0007EEAE32|nr:MULTISPECIES: MFS transporter [unclassified Shewanella]MBQ4890752.1 MFS transporter [Shewanella sp. MMG014]OBT06781.1 MFS transporter [Shewanella sp. UCD-FRSSP16_17]